MNTAHQTTGCQCTEPGWCERHGCKKSENWWRLCQTNTDYFALWETGHGPGQESNGKPRRRKRCGEKKQKAIVPHAWKNGGLRTADWEVQDRLAACRTCPYFKDGDKQRCTHIDLGCATTFWGTLHSTAGRCPEDNWKPTHISWIRTSDLIRDAGNIAEQLDRSFSVVVGIARSGLMPASVIATALHLPMAAMAHDTGVVTLGGGFRAPSRGAGMERRLIVDDSVGSGHQIRTLRQIGAITPTDHVLAIYAVAINAGVVDQYARRVRAPHLFEWNFFNSCNVPLAALDLDGVICHDAPPGCYDDGPRELEWFRTAKPRYVPRSEKFHTPAIITARCEKYRAVTEEWLARQGVYYRRLIMWDGPPEERTLHHVAQWKVNQVRIVNASFYVESCRHMAEAMRQLHCRVLTIAEGVLR